MAKKYKIEYLPIAEQDLANIIEYIQSDNAPAALNLLNQFDETISLLEEFQLMGQVPKDNRLQLLKYRILIVGGYLVFYVVIDDVIEIRRILHGKRKYDFLF